MAAGEADAQPEDGQEAQGLIFAGSQDPAYKRARLFRPQRLDRIDGQRVPRREIAR